MRAGQALLLAAVAGLGIALLSLSAFHMTTVGTCGTGSSRYGAQVGPACPHNMGYWIGALAGSALLAIVVTGATSLLAGPVFALALGGACLASLVTGAASGSWVIAAAVLGAIFTPIGLGGIWLRRRSIGPRFAAVLPAAAVGAVGGVALALAIPGPLRQPKQITFAQIDKVGALSADSWFQPANLRRALGVVTGKLGADAQITSMWIQPGIAVIEAVKGQVRHSFSLRFGGGEDDFTSATSDDKTVPIRTIDTAAPQHLLGQLRKQFHLAGDRIDEIGFALGVIDGLPGWNAHVKNTPNISQYTSDAHGMGVKPPTSS